VAQLWYPDTIDPLPTGWTQWSIGFIRRAVGRVAARSKAVTANIFVPLVGRKFSLLRIRSVQFVAGHFRIQAEMITSAEFVLRAIRTLPVPIPGPAIQEKKRQSIRSGR
jgi:hypothetical protein